MKHRFVIGLLIVSLFLAFGASRSLAVLPANPEGYVLPSYPLIGTVSRPDDGALSDYRVFVYKTDNIRPIAGQALTDASGNFMVNLYELYFTYGTAVHTDLTTRANIDQYYVGVYSRDGFGKNPVPLTNFIAAWNAVEGFTAIGAIALVAGEGPVEPGGGTLEGVVTNSFGNLIRNVTVTIAGSSAQSGLDGTYRVTNILPGTYTVTATAADYQTATISDVVIEAGATSQLNITLTPSSDPGDLGGLAGQVTGSSLIPGVLVSIGDLSAVTGDDGMYTIGGVQPASYTVTASKTGYIPFAQENVAIEAGRTTMLDFQLVREGTGPLQITTDSLAAGTVGVNYAVNLEAAGGTEPYTWSITFGELPPELALAGNTISGIPTARGTYEFVIKVTDSFGATAEQRFSIYIGYQIVDIPYGPQIRVSALFQALVNTTTWSHTIPQIVRVEARTGASPAAATSLVGYADIILSENSDKTTGRNGFLRPDGTEFGAGTPMSDNDYYIVVKQWLTPALVGFGHMSVITNRLINLITGAERDASTTRLDLTADPTLADAPADRIYKETPYGPSADKPDALLTFNNRTMFRVGDLDSNNYIDVIDASHWYRLFSRFNSTGEDVIADPFIRADLDQNGLVDVIDSSWWYGSFRNLSIELNDAGPHGYVPPLE
ncbi:hypothetical protein A3H38_06825 [candidate division WOR-1 bacterium RIFCSPLOWO2_02_FULL_46_20]|uniref:Dystroglycan-type cadherin-like domain-containing protein n=1 Tax=candidate division WOR-1 bacterium RIFCSPLOWO2_02_FULL_46_20 TaxID=1802567 RepID=A0A1F4RCI8_UNCSA|nr:MAG: hypothetical protein A3H38_06825 [candidate division WOR-1 bacterium RIFCSPLOWO2_02_FULL_46_20]